MTWRETGGALVAALILASATTGLGQEVGGCGANCATTSCCCNDQCVEPGGTSCDMACAFYDANQNRPVATQTTFEVGSYRGPFSMTADGDYLLAGKVKVSKANVSQTGQLLTIWLTRSASLAKSTFTWPPKTHAPAEGSGLHYFHMCKSCGGRGGCDAAWCIDSGSHVVCKGGKPSTSCDSSP